MSHNHAWLMYLSKFLGFAIQTYLPFLSLNIFFVLRFDHGKGKNWQPPHSCTKKYSNHSFFLYWLTNERNMNLVQECGGVEKFTILSVSALKFENFQGQPFLKTIVWRHSTCNRNKMCWFLSLYLYSLKRGTNMMINTRNNFLANLRPILALIVP